MTTSSAHFSTSINFALSQSRASRASSHSWNNTTFSIVRLRRLFLNQDSRTIEVKRLIATSHRESSTSQPSSCSQSMLSLATSEAWTRFFLLYAKCSKPCRHTLTCHQTIRASTPSQSGLISLAPLKPQIRWARTTPVSSNSTSKDACRDSMMLCCVVTDCITRTQWPPLISQTL